MTRLSKWRRSSVFAFLVPAVMAVFALLVVSATINGARPVSAATASAARGDATAGQKVFLSNCTSCHGSSLEGGVGPKLNPITKLNGVSNPLDPAYLLTTVKNGRANGAMPAWGGKLSDQQIQDVVAFIIAQNKIVGGAPYTSQELAISDLEWITISLLALLALTWMLARYNMRWIARRAAARRAGEGGSGRHN